MQKEGQAEEEEGSPPEEKEEVTFANGAVYKGKVNSCISVC